MRNTYCCFLVGCCFSNRSLWPFNYLKAHPYSFTLNSINLNHRHALKCLEQAQKQQRDRDCTHLPWHVTTHDGKMMRSWTAAKSANNKQGHEKEQEHQQCSCSHTNEKTVVCITENARRLFKNLSYDNSSMSLRMHKNLSPYQVFQNNMQYSHGNRLLRLAFEFFLSIYCSCIRNACGQEPNSTRFQFNFRRSFIERRR